MKFYYSNNGVTVYLMRDIRRKNPDGDCQLKWCITYKRERVYYSTGKTLNGANWNLFEISDEPDFTYKSKALHLKGIKDDLEGYFDITLKKAVSDLITNNNFTFDELDRRLKGRGDISVNEAFTKRINALNKYNKAGNEKVYRTVYNALVKFKHYKKKRGSDAKIKFLKWCIEERHKTSSKDFLVLDDKIEFNEITPKFLSECEDFWRETNISDASIGLYMRTIRALINNKPFIKNKDDTGGDPYLTDNRYPFGDENGKYSIPEGGRRNLALPIRDIWKIESFETSNYGIELARDIFMFQFFGNGMNFGDLCRLQFSNINSYTNEISFIRKKTRDTKKGKPEPICVPILPPMVEIINRHGNKDQSGYIFPFLNGIKPSAKNESKIKSTISDALIKINSSLKIISAELNLPSNLSTSWTRNSYITHLTSEMYISHILVKQMVGHSTRKDVTAGYNSATPDKRREINSQLLNPDKKYNAIGAVKVV